MAKPITDPLRVDPGDVTDVDLNDPQHDEINKGMPARHYKLWLLVLGAIGVVAMLAWPAKPIVGKGPTAASVRGPNDQQPGAAVVASLQADADGRKTPPPEQHPNTRPLAGPNYDSGVGTNGSAAGAMFGAQGQPQMTPEEKEEARRQAILASGTEASEVSFRTNNTAPRQTVTEADRLERETANRSRALQEQQMKLLDSIQNGTFGQGGAPGAAASRTAGATGSTSGSNANQDFINGVASKGVEPAQHMTAARPGLALYQGTIVHTVLDKAINTDLPGSIRAHVTSDVFDSITGTHCLIPRGSVVIGEYSTGLVVGQDRVLVALSRLILPNGQSVGLLGTPAGDGQGVSGLTADIDNHFLKMFGASAMIGAASLLLPSTQQNITVTSGAGGITSGGTVFATSLQDMIKNIVQRNLNIKPTGTVDLGETFTFTLSRDIMMDAYQGPAK
jgi:type IV secretory pathway VirB10-like protein